VPTATNRCRDAGTPLWKLILKQFDDLLVKVFPKTALLDAAAADFAHSAA
jgi:hypothetical protein